MKLKVDIFLEKFLAKSDFDKPTNAKDSIKVIKRIKLNNTKATFLFVPWQSGDVMQRWIMKQVPKSRDTYSISPRSLLLKDPIQTKEQCIRVCEEATKRVQQILNENNYKEINIVGLSVGTGVAAYAANRIKSANLKFVDFVCPGAELSTALWLGSRTQNLKDCYEEQGFSLMQIQKEWSRVDLINNLDFAKSTKLRITYSKSDLVIVPRQSEKVITNLKSSNTYLKVKTNRYFGHYLTMFWVWLTWRTVYLSGKIK
ncbi:MAG: hypothetical protein H6799_00380 [Candidatus Nomurabacteria bacterium]|nr:MAG: hypothetical protein H6799_00380 [Candidatus Nomurabacteria bacterium]HRV76137.1 hypothetical protein [Candidatus Saccharimonadales bacterium]